MPLNQPTRVHRTRNFGRATPLGALYVGRPTLWGNPFQRRGIGHARGVILFGAWLAGELTPHILSRAGFGDDEIDGLARRHTRVIAQLHHLRGFDLQCWCPLTSPWCHADTLLRCANPVAIAPRLAA